MITKGQSRMLVFTASICAMALTAGAVDMMVATASQESVHHTTTVNVNNLPSSDFEPYTYNGQ